MQGPYCANITVLRRPGRLPRPPGQSLLGKVGEGWRPHFTYSRQDGPYQEGDI